MTHSKQFESLKQKAIEDYTIYLNAIKHFSFEDVKNLNKRINLLDVYNKAVVSNSSYRKFITDLDKTSL